MTGKGYRPTSRGSGRLRWVTFAICIAFFALTVALPVGQLLLSSFFQFFGFYQLDMLTLEHYRSVWENSEFWRAFGNTMLLGCRRRHGDHGAGRHRRLRHHAHALARPAADRRPRLAALDDAGHGAGHRLPVGLRHPAACHPDLRHAVGAAAGLCRARHAGRGARDLGRLCRRSPRDIEECSRVHGAGWWQTLGRILVALAWPAFAVGWVLIFFGIMRELSASILLYAPGTEVLSVVMLKMWVSGKPEEVSVIGLVMLVLVLVFRWVQLQFIKRRISTL